MAGCRGVGEGAFSSPAPRWARSSVWPTLRTPYRDALVRALSNQGCRVPPQPQGIRAVAIG